MVASLYQELKCSGPAPLLQTDFRSFTYGMRAVAQISNRRTTPYKFISENDLTIIQFKIIYTGRKKPAINYQFITWECCCKRYRDSNYCLINFALSDFSFVVISKK